MALSIYQEYTLSYFFFVSLSRTYIFFPQESAFLNVFYHP